MVAALGILALLGPLPVADAQPSVPDAPVNVTATPGDAQVTLAWTPGDDNGSTIIRYEYTYDENGVATSVWFPIPNSNRHTTGYTVTGLTNGTAYQFYLRAINLEGNGAVATAVSVPAVPATTPDPVTQVVATPGNSQATLTWIPGFDGGSPVLYYEFRQREGNNPYSPWSIMVGSDATTTSYTVTGLTNGVTYRFQVRAVNAIGPTPLPTPPPPDPEPEPEEEEGEADPEPEEEEPEEEEPETTEPDTTEPKDDEPDTTEPEEGRARRRRTGGRGAGHDRAPKRTSPKKKNRRKRSRTRPSPKKKTSRTPPSPKRRNQKTTNQKKTEPEEEEPDDEQEEEPEPEKPVVPIVVPPAGSTFYSGSMSSPGPEYLHRLLAGRPPPLPPRRRWRRHRRRVLAAPHPPRGHRPPKRADRAGPTIITDLYTTLVNAACATVEGTAPCGGDPLSAPPTLPPAGHRLYSGDVITGPGFCANRSLGGPTTYPHDSNGDGVADVCSLPYTRREAIARQQAGDTLAKTFPAQFETLGPNQLPGPGHRRLRRRPRRL